MSLNLEQQSTLKEWMNEWSLIQMSFLANYYHKHEINKFIIILNSKKLKRNNIQYQHFLEIHAGRYEDIAMHPEKELQDISDYFNLTLLEDAESFLQEHASAKWHEKNRYQ